MEFVDKIPQLIYTVTNNSHKLIGFLMIVIFALSTICVITFGSIFIFHWRKYGDGGKNLKNAEWIFVFGSLAILFLMILSLLSFWF